MKKRIARILCGVLLLGSAFSLTGCKDDVIFERITFEQAVENGFITTEQVKSVAYYYNNYYNENPPEPDFELIPKVKLSKKTVRNIKKSYLHHQGYTNATTRNIENYKYYGTYNDYAIVSMKVEFVCYDLIITAEKIIGGVSFFNYSGDLYAYKTIK